MHSRQIGRATTCWQPRRNERNEDAAQLGICCFGTERGRSSSGRTAGIPALSVATDNRNHPVIQTALRPHADPLDLDDAGSPRVAGEFRRGKGSNRRLRRRGSRPGPVGDANDAAHPRHEPGELGCLLVRLAPSNPKVVSLLGLNGRLIDICLRRWTLLRAAGRHGSLLLP